MTFPFSVATQSASPIHFDVDLGSTGDYRQYEFVRARDSRSDKPSTVYYATAEQRLGDRLFEATAAAKKWTAVVAMRLHPEDRRRIFAQLDRLHDEGEWHEASTPLRLESYKSFIRALVSGQISGKPSLAITANGNLTAIWHSQHGRLLIEFQHGDRVRYLVNHLIDGSPERAAGETSASRLQVVLAPYSGVDGFCAA